MYRKYLIASAIVAALVAPAFAATSTTMTPTKHTYYVSQDKTTLKCYVVTKIGKNGQQIGKITYPTKSKATAAMKVASECNKM